MDFDGGISFEEVKARTEKYDLPMLFAYDTLSSENHDKFRVVFLNDVSISDREVVEAIQQAMGTIFPEADPSCCRDVSKMYYGGKTVLYYDDKIQKTNIESVFRNLTCYLKEEYKPNHYKERITRFSRETGIGLNKNGLLDVTVTDDPTELLGANQSDQNGKNSPTPIIYKSIYRIVDGEIFPTKYYCINLIDGSGTSKSSVGKKTLKKP